MNIDERCYGYEPAQSQLNIMRRELKALNEKLPKYKRLVEVCAGLDDDPDNSKLHEAITLAQQIKEGK